MNDGDTALEHIYLAMYVRKVAPFAKMKILNSCWQQDLPAMLCWIFITHTAGRQQMPTFLLLTTPCKKRQNSLHGVIMF